MSSRCLACLLSPSDICNECESVGCCYTHSKRLYQFNPKDGDCAIICCNLCYNKVQDRFCDSGQMFWVAPLEY